MSVVIDTNELLGRALGTCTLKRLLGRGGMGAVYLAQQSRPRRAVAVKVLLPGIVMDKKTRSAFLARFRREADAVAALDHIHIMPIYEYGEVEELAYLVMPYVTGGTLREVLEERGTLPLTEATTIIEQAAAGLDCAHAQGIVHRDLKPGNMLFHADGRLLLADFGLAKVLKDTTEQDKDSTRRMALTSVGTIVGTPEYLSPEQGTARPIDHRTDIYSLGIVLFQMLTGRVPFTGASPVAIALRHTLEDPPSVSELNPAIPPEIEAVLMKALAKQAQDRYASAGEFARALRCAVSENHHDNQVQPSPSTLTVPPERLTPIVLPSNEPLSAMPTVDIQDAALDFHDAATMREQLQPEPKAENQQEPQSADVAEQNEAIAPLIQAKQAPPRQPAASEQAGPVSISEVPTRPEALRPRKQAVEPARGNQPALARRPAGCQSVGMMLLGSLLTLVVVASFAAYLHFAPQLHLTSNTTPKLHATITPESHQPQKLPPPQIPVGPLLYGTTLPGKACDTRGGRWSSTTNARVQCGATSTELVNADTNHLAGTFLDGLPDGKAVPDDYALQVQVSVAPDSHGTFGVFFRNQPGARQGTYSFLLNPAGTWGAYTYDNTSGAASPLVTRPLQGNINGTVTIDIVVQGDTFTFYVNGVEQGYAQSGAYPSGTLGLAADGGADVFFKNLAIYALS
jgi:serine/threonine protein kinase